VSHPEEVDFVTDPTLPGGPGPSHQSIVTEEALGRTHETPRSISPIKIIGAGWNICQSWTGVAATMAISITQGGTVAVIYGLLVIFVTMGCSAATLGELASVYPTAGGQYHWTSILAPKDMSRGLVWPRLLSSL
jgi:choline transport protein